MSRTTTFLTVLSAAVVALALVANATGFGPTTRTVALTAPTLVATVDAAVATAIVVLLIQATAAPWVVVVAAGAIAFPVVWGALSSLNARTVQTLRATEPRSPTPEQDA